jgi:1,4-alpha-glucan branching enzyme
MKTGTMVPYAIKRTTDHLLRFQRLYEQILNRRVDDGALKAIEERDTCFPGLDLDRTFRPPSPEFDSSERSE